MSGSWVFESRADPSAHLAHLRVTAKSGHVEGHCSVLSDLVGVRPFTQEKKRGTGLEWGTEGMGVAESIGQHT